MTKRESKEKRVEDIVSAAVEVFMEKGYEGASMDSIAKKAGVSKGGLYHHFSSKDEILFYANEKLSEPVYMFIHSAKENPDVIEAIRNYIRSYIEYWVQHPKELSFFFLTMTKALTCPEMWVIYEDYFNKLGGFFTELFERGVKEGRFIDHNVKAGAVSLMSALDGVLVYLIMHKGLNPDEVILGFEDRFINPILKR